MSHRGFEVSGCDSLISGKFENVPDGIEFRQLDCRNHEQLAKEALSDCTTFIHCAAAPYEGLSNIAPNLVTENTLNATLGALVASANSNIKHFIYLSSMARYGHGKAPFKEIDDVNPCDPYGIAKVSSELLVKNICETQNIASQID